MFSCFRKILIEHTFLLLRIFLVTVQHLFKINFLLLRNQYFAALINIPYYLTISRLLPVISFFTTIFLSIRSLSSSTCEIIPASLLLPARSVSMRIA